MKKIGTLLLAVCCAIVIGAARGDEDGTSFHAALRGLNEVPPVATAGTGTFSAQLEAGGTRLHYTETYSTLNAQVLFSHIHFGLTRESGGVVVFLCGPAAGQPGGPPMGIPDPPPCPGPTGGTVSGDVTAANVIGPNAQGITPGADFDKLVHLLREGAGYVNVHTMRSPGGEIRGQVRLGDGDEDRR